MTSPLALMQERRRCLAGSRALSARPPGEADAQTLSAWPGPSPFRAASFPELRYVLQPVPTSCPADGQAAVRRLCPALKAAFSCAVLRLFTETEP